MTKLAHVKLLVVDIDGTLTDGAIWLDHQGNETIRFHVRDGLGLKMIADMGIDVIALSGREHAVAASFLAQRGVTQTISTCADKRLAIAEIADDRSMKMEHIAMVGDDTPDQGAVESVGVGIAVSDAASTLVQAADLRLTSRGGHGAIRELAVLLETARKEWKEKEEAKAKALADAAAAEAAQQAKDAEELAAMAEAEAATDNDMKADVSDDEIADDVDDIDIDDDIDGDINDEISEDAIDDETEMMASAADENSTEVADASEVEPMSDDEQSGDADSEVTKEPTS